MILISKIKSETTGLKILNPLWIFFLPIGCFLLILSSCGVYSFNDVSLPDSIKTVRIGFIENKARFINPQLSPSLTDRLRQKIVSQTRLSQTNNENADFDISGEIREYSVSTSGVTSNNGQSQSSIQRLNVSVHIVLNNQKTGIVQEYDITRNFDFSANQSLQDAERNLLDEMVRTLSDEIFNRIFSNW